MSNQTFYLASKVRLYPNKEQELLFRKTIGCCRFIYNHFLALKLEEYSRYKKHLSKNKDCKKFKWKVLPTEASLKDEFEWLKEVDSSALQFSKMHLETAFKNYHKHGFGKPRFHKKGIKDRFKVPNKNGTSLRVEDNSIRISKNGFIKFRGSITTGKIKSITVSCEANQWFASILLEVDSTTYYQPKEFKYESVGVDLGITQPLTVSTNTGRDVHIGKKVTKKLKELEIRRKRYQRSMSRKVKGSNNRHKARLKVQKAYQKERNVRKEFIETTSNKIASNCELIVFEDLKLSNMTRSAKGTLDKPGTSVSVKAKAGLNRELLRLGLSGLLKRTVDKSYRYGSTVMFVNPRYTSQTCSGCGCVNKLSRESQSRFKCVDCGFKLNADKNAARNILAKGLSLQ